MAGSLGILCRLCAGPDSSVLSCRMGKVLLLSELRKGTGGCEGENVDGISDTGSELNLFINVGDMTSSSDGLAGLGGGPFLDPSGCEYIEPAVGGLGGRSSGTEAMLGTLGLRPSMCDGNGGTCSSLLLFLRLASKGPFFKVFALLTMFSPAVKPPAKGLRGISGRVGAGCASKGLSCFMPLLDGALSLFVGVLRPLLVPGLLPGVDEVGNGGNAQSKLPVSSGLGGRKSKRLGIGLVALRLYDGLELPLLPDLALSAGLNGVFDRGGCGARKGLLAASGLILGGADLLGFGPGCCPDPRVGARTLVCGGAAWFCAGGWLGYCTGAGIVAGFSPTACNWRRVNGLFKSPFPPGDIGALPHI